MAEQVLEQAQEALFDLSGREFNAMWVDESQPLFIANNPLHWKAHKLQVALARMDVMAQKNPAQFNSTTYFAALDKLTEIMEEINKRGDHGEILDKGSMAGERHDAGAPIDGKVKPISMDS